MDSFNSLFEYDNQAFKGGELVRSMETTTSNEWLYIPLDRGIYRFELKGGKGGKAYADPKFNTKEAIAAALYASGKDGKDGRNGRDGRDGLRGTSAVKTDDEIKKYFENINHPYFKIEDIDNE
jgi:hypothetical protein